MMGTSTSQNPPPLLLKKHERNAVLEKKLARDEEINFMGTLDLSSLNLTDDDIPLIVQRIFLQDRRKCTRLILRDNRLTSNGVQVLVDHLLRVSPELKYLGLSGNKNIGDSGIEHLVRLLRVNRSITLLALHNTGISDEGIQILAQVLCADVNDDPPGSILQKLYIPFNKYITDKSLVVLRQVLEHNQTLNVLSVQNCTLSNIARKRLKELAKKKRNFRFTV